MKKIIFLAIVALIIFPFVKAEVNDSVNQTGLIYGAASFNLTSVYPKTFNLGDVVFALGVKNTGNLTLENLIALISGGGFSTYEIVPVDELAPESESYILVSGNFKESGDVSLKISINNNVFYEKVSVKSLTTDEQEKIKAENQNILADVSSQLDELKSNFTALESDVADKKDNNFDVSGINLADLRSYIRTAESSILSGNADSAKVNIRLALEEYLYQKKKTDSSKEISIVDRLKNNALIFSALAGAIIVFFSLYELLKRKKSDVVNTVRSVHNRFRKKD